MAGIVFFSTKKLDEIHEFYTNRLDMKVWLKQVDCTIFRHGNLLVAFCQRSQAETNGMITLFYKSKAEVDEKYQELLDIAISEPKQNERYRIYQFFAKDPEGRNLEFQFFWDEMKPECQSFETCR